MIVVSPSSESRTSVVVIQSGVDRRHPDSHRRCKLNVTLSYYIRLLRSSPSRFPPATYFQRFLFHNNLLLFIFIFFSLSLSTFHSTTRSHVYIILIRSLTLCRDHESAELFSSQEPTPCCACIIIIIIILNKLKNIRLLND